MHFSLARIDTGDDDRVSKEEFCADAMKPTIEKWVGPIEDMGAEFDGIDTNGGGQVSTEGYSRKGLKRLNG